MTITDNGTQQVGWMYETPLVAETLNSFLSATATPGLLTRPTTDAVEYKVTDGDKRVAISPFSALLTPIYDISGDDASDAKIFGKPLDPDGYLTGRLVKITTDSQMTVSVNANTVALGLVYSMNQIGSPTIVRTYSQIIAINQMDIEGSKTKVLKWKNWRMIIIATACLRKAGDDLFISFSTNGATLSSVLLEREGWKDSVYVDIKNIFNIARNTDTAWSTSSDVSVTHNVLTVNSIYNCLTANHFLNGYNGLVNITQNTAKIIIPFLKYDDSEGVKRLCLNGWNQLKNSSLKINTSTQRPYRYQVIVLDTDNSSGSYLRIEAGFDAPNSSSGLCVNSTSGSVIALIDFGNNSVLATETEPVQLWRNMKIIPVAKETSNTWYDSSTGTLFIK